MAITLIALALSVSGCGKKPAKPAPAMSTYPVEQLPAYLKAAAMLEVDEFPSAQKALVAIRNNVGDAPGVLANTAIAAIAQQNMALADEMSARAIEKAPDAPRVMLVRAYVLWQMGERDQAIGLFTAAAGQDPLDGVLQWALLSQLEGMGLKPGDAELRAAAQRAAAATPRNLVVMLKLASLDASAGDTDSARVWLERAISLVGAPPADALDMWEGLPGASDSEVRTFASVLRNLLLPTDRFRSDLLLVDPRGGTLPPTLLHPVLPLSDTTLPPLGAKISFEEGTAGLGLEQLANTPGARRVISGWLSDEEPFALAVLSGDRRLTLLAKRDGLYADVTRQYGLEGSSAPSGCFYDVDNDRYADLVLLDPEGDALMRRAPQGGFVDETESRLPVRRGSVGALPFDIEHDGDLDLLRWSATELSVLRNNGEGVFDLELIPDGLPASLSGIQAAYALDHDDDGDVDLVLTLPGQSPSVRVFYNERLGRFREIESEGAPAGARTHVVVADYDGDARLDVCDLASGRYLPGASPGAWRDMDASGGVAVLGDFDNDGRPDAVGSGDAGLARIDRDGSVALDLNEDGLLDVLTPDGRAYLNTTQGAGNWLAVSLVGLNQGSSKFNTLGIGSSIDVSAGVLRVRAQVAGYTTHVGLGPYTSADVLRIGWPNGAYQNLRFRESISTEIAGNQRLVEEQTLKGSCPYLFAWNGERFEFVTDVLWRTAIGMPLTETLLGHHHPADDSFRIPPGLLQPKDGVFELRFTEELWEVAYLDVIDLKAIDHPVGTEVYVDERCAPPPYPDPGPFLVDVARTPRSIVDGEGRDVLPLLRARDERYVADFSPTPYQGIVGDHELIIDLGPIPADQTLRLYLQGWVWPTDASVNIAVSQRPDVSIRPPAIDVPDGQGGWTNAIPFLGFPSGKGKTLVADLTGVLPDGYTTLRLRTNMDISWDRIFFTLGDQDERMRETVVPLLDAVKRERGLSIEVPTTADGPLVPAYDLLDRDRVWREMTGDATPPGSVTSKLLAMDDDYVIVKAGGEIVLRFDASVLSPLAAGWTRTFIIHTDGWLKDGDLNTRAGQTVGPLPHSGMERYP